MSKSTTRKGFTLIELLVVVSIIGMLSSVVFSSINGARAKGRDSKRMSSTVQLRTAMELYRGVHNAYPSTGTATYFNSQTNCSTDDVTGFREEHTGNTLIPGLVSEKFISSLPTDPAGKALCVIYQSNGTDYKITYRYALEDQKLVSTNQFYDTGWPSDGADTSITLYSAGAKNWDLSSQMW